MQGLTILLGLTVIVFVAITISINFYSIVSNYQSLPILYIITATYDRPTQIPDLTRLLHTLLHVKNLHWIVIEDAFQESTQVKHLLKQSKIQHTYLTAKTLKGIAQRNEALSWIRKNHELSKPGILYFADDDNVYSLNLFDEMRKTRKISVWPVGFSGEDHKLIFQTPIVEEGRVVGFYSWNPYRSFAIDMAGFAINVKVLFDYPKMMFPYNTISGYMESTFLQQFCTLEELEPMADSCTKILVWQVRTERPDVLLHTSIRHIEWNVTKLISTLNINPNLYKIQIIQ